MDLRCAMRALVRGAPEWLAGRNVTGLTVLSALANEVPTVVSARAPTNIAFHIPNSAGCYCAARDTECRRLSQAEFPLNSEWVPGSTFCGNIATHLPRKTAGFLSVYA